MSWDEADPLTAAFIMTAAQFSESIEYKVASLEAAKATLLEMSDLEGRLEKTGQYCIAGPAIMKVRGTD